MKVKEIRVLSPEELARQLEAARKDLFDLRCRLANMQLVNHREILFPKKEIARLKTIMRERELGIR